MGKTRYILHTCTQWVKRQLHLSGQRDRNRLNDYLCHHTTLPKKSLNYHWIRHESCSRCITTLGSAKLQELSMIARYTFGGFILRHHNCLIFCAGINLEPSRLVFGKVTTRTFYGRSFDRYTLECTKDPESIRF